MESDTQIINNKQHEHKLQIRKTRVDTYIAERRQQNLKIIETNATNLDLEETTTEVNLLTVQQLLKSLQTNQQNSDHKLYLLYRMLKNISPNQQECSSIFVNLLFYYIIQYSSKTSYQIVCTWVVKPQVAKYIFINQLFKNLPDYQPNNEFSSYNIEIFKVLSQSIIDQISDNKFITMTYRLVSCLFSKWAIYQQPLFMSSIINLLRQNICDAAIFLVVQNNMDLLSVVAQKMKSPDTTIDNKMLYSIMIDLLFLTGDQIVITLMLAGFADIISIMLQDPKLLPFGLSCLQSILRIQQNQNQISILIKQNNYLSTLNNWITKYLYSQNIIDQNIDDHLMKCIVYAQQFHNVQFDINKFIPGCNNRLCNPSLRMNTLQLLKMQIQKNQQEVIKLLEFFSGKEVLQKIAQQEVYQYSRQLAQNILSLLARAMEQQEQTD